jgi:signal peptidase I
VGSPERGDIVVFKPPRGADSNVCGVEVSDRQACPKPTPERSDTNFIKRVVGLPGDRISIVGGRVQVNGRLLDEPYIRPDDNCGICNLPVEIRVPPDHFFMMGDNRGASADSREWGPVRREWLIGQARVTYWPPGRVGTL